MRFFSDDITRRIFALNFDLLTNKIKQLASVSKKLKPFGY